MKLTMLGTGHAMVTECYNTCFAISEQNQCFLVDGGGGNTVLRQLKLAGLPPAQIHDIFITHKHIDHLLGIIWVSRAICQQMLKGEYTGKLNLYAHEEAIALIRDLLQKLLLKKQRKIMEERFCFFPVSDGESRPILDRTVTFFDIQSVKEKQFGFSMDLGTGEKLTCCGAEPYRPCEKKYAENSAWLLHEAFCLYTQAELFSPYEKHHSTVKDACETAEQLGVRNLILYHAEDSCLPERKKLYQEEGSRYFHGNLYVPDDLETFLL